MGALRPAFLNRHLGGQNTIHRAFAAQVDLFVEQRGHFAASRAGWPVGRVPLGVVPWVATALNKVCLPELILEPCVSPLQLAYLLIQRISLRLAAAFLRQGLSDPLCAALRHVVRCDEYRPSRRRS